MKVAVVGAGIIGLTSAVKIKERYPNSEVVLISRDFSPNTTGDGSGGLWYPYLCGDTSQDLLTKWGTASYKFLHELWLEGGHNVCLIPIYCFYGDHEVQKPQWADITFGYEILNKKQLDYYSQFYNSKYCSGISFATFVVQPALFLEYFMNRFKRTNGRIKKAQIVSLKDPLLEKYDVVVNCSGMGAREIVPDIHVYPVRGQVAKVIAPWANQVIVDEDGGNYIIPNAATCVLGGTHQEHEYNRKVDEKDTEFIINGCRRMVPGLEHARIVNHWAGLRPARFEIRLEAEERHGKLFIHNYGHGGSGLTLFWGCAEDVLDIVSARMRSVAKINAKL